MSFFEEVQHFLTDKGQVKVVCYCLEASFGEQSKHMFERVMISFRSILYTMMDFRRDISAGHVWNNGCHNCPLQLVNLPTPPNQSLQHCKHWLHSHVKRETIFHQGAKRWLWDSDVSFIGAVGVTVKWPTLDVFESMAGGLGKKVSKKTNVKKQNIFPFCG